MLPMLLYSQLQLGLPCVEASLRADRLHAVHLTQSSAAVALLSVANQHVLSTSSVV